MRVGVLGATGVVGQHYVQLLQDHPWFEVTFLAASSKSSGKTYVDALKGRMEYPVHDQIASIPVHAIDEISLARERCDLVFSAVDNHTAAMWEETYAEHLPIVSNASCHRMTEDVPLIFPEINDSHLEAIPFQQKRRGWRGSLIVKPNCTVQSYLLPLYVLHQIYPLKKALITTMQALSGAGYPGVSALDGLDNLIPYIPGEEEKCLLEPQKIMGKWQDNQFHLNHEIAFSVQCNRVPVRDGHTASVAIQFAGEKPTLDEVIDLWESYRGMPQTLQLPTAPKQPIHYLRERGRPQPRIDRHCEKGMAITVGRLQHCPALDMRFVALSHNTIRGAAGGGLLMAELHFALWHKSAIDTSCHRPEANSCYPNLFGELNLCDLCGKIHTLASGVCKSHQVLRPR